MARTASCNSRSWLPDKRSDALTASIVVTREPAHLRRTRQVLSTVRYLILSGSVATFAAACGDRPLYGDDLYSVEIENATPTVLVVSEIQVLPSASPMVTRIAPGKTVLSGWRRPREGRPEERATVRAENEAGTLVFCQTYTYADMKRMRQHITIAAGTLAC